MLQCWNCLALASSTDNDIMLSNIIICESTLSRMYAYNTGMPLGLFKKVGKYPGTGGLGVEPPAAGSRGSTLVGEARAFSQSELPRKPPIDTHGRYTYNTCTGGGGGGGRKKTSRKVWKSQNSDKSRKDGIPDNNRLWCTMFMTIMKINKTNIFVIYQEALYPLT